MQPMQQVDGRRVVGRKPGRGQQPHSRGGQPLAVNAQPRPTLTHS
ncbi:MAG: hypothetical protein ABR898_09525 [Terracidiphilus sp.]